MDKLAIEAKQFGVFLADRELKMFEKYYSFLIDWNLAINLTTITEKDEVVSKHFLDSLSIAPKLPNESSSAVDIGSGAGFPGIPLAIVRPDIAFTLVDAVAKKTSFLSAVAEALGLGNIRVIQARAEDLGKHRDFREKFDVGLARAVADLSVLAEFVLPLVRDGGIFIAQKNADSEETESARGALAALGGQITQTVPVEIRGEKKRQLIIIKKVSPTPEKYPRKAGIPKKRPL